ncbi:uncharacterized protein [Musca autumnalis]|uniref:uncharacterized protein n=1 Tax=Musca autumnalis TaxID=221902 RepID=UPI003CF1998F
MLSINELTCRVCLHEQQILINVFDELEDLETSLCSLLEKCGGIQIGDNDIFPKYLCEECTRELLISAKFRDKCAKSKELYDELIKDGNLNGVVDGVVIAEDSCKEQQFAEYTLENETEENEFETIATINEQTESNETNESLDHVEDNLENQIIEEEVANVTHFPEEIQEVEKQEGDCITATFDDTNEIVVEEDSSGMQYEANVNDFEVHIDLSNSAFMKSMPVRVRKLKSYKCDICGAAFVQSINLKKHLQKTHTLNQCYMCTTCDHWFSSEIELVKHADICKELSSDEEMLSSDEQKNKVQKSLVSNGAIESDRRCVYCERDFPTPFALRMHLRSHTGERPFQCPHCEKSFKTQSSLNSHVKRHTGQADFVCSVCGKAFYERGNLDVHMQTHTGERPHSCTVCGKKFTRVFLLELHMRIHTGEKPYPCNYCDKSFRQRSDWKNHLSTHTGIKKHKCNYCIKSYMKRSSLVQHMQKQHSLLQFDSDYLAEQISTEPNINCLDDIIENEEDIETNDIT